MCIRDRPISAISFAQRGLYAPGNLNNFFDFKFLARSERFSDIVFLVKCIRGDLY